MTTVDEPLKFWKEPLASMDVVKLRTGRLTYKGYDWGYGLYD